MHYRSRLAFRKLLFAALLGLAVPSLALAQDVPPGANPQAESLNEQGKDLYKNKDFQGAAAKFREANSIQPDGRYYFNLCATLEKAGDLDGALEACDSVYQYSPNDELKGKTGQRAASIRQSIRQRNGQTGNPPPPDPNQPPPPPDGNPPVGTPPGGSVQPPGPEVTKTIPGHYKWAFGGELGALVSDDITDSFDGGGLLRLHADKTFGERLGGRLFLGLGGSSGSPGLAGSETTTYVEFGAAGFTNIRLSDNLYITPMVGVLLAGIQKSGDAALSSNDSIGTFGVNLGLPITYTFGNGKHAIFVNPLAFTYYLPSSSSSDSGLETNNFDGGTTFMISFGYQMRLQEGEKLPGFVVLE
jgi:tetratricopeptide (TPR) repeat protein